jgi:hypothetical protein
MTIAVYTAVFGGYDQLRPGRFPEEAKYICFSDRAFAAPEPWQVRVVNPLPGSLQKASRYYFTQATRVLLKYDYTIMHGGNAVLMTAPTTLISILGDNDIAAFRHPHRYSVYDEPKACAMLGKDRIENMAPQIARYRMEGFPGTPFSACILLVRRNTKAIAALEALWWAEVQAGSYRDQLSFDYARWVTETPVTYIPGDPFASQHLSIYEHIR